jgi:hypothetical protein
VLDAATCTCKCPACTQGGVLDEATCNCLCPAPTACCVCFDQATQTIPLCLNGQTTHAECEAACQGVGAELTSYASHLIGSTYVCNAEGTCDATCQFEIPGDPGD